MEPLIAYIHIVAWAGYMMRQAWNSLLNALHK